jgi:CRP/FNR family transcriptional regulator, anaerobic regulatory protein
MPRPTSNGKNKPFGTPCESCPFQKVPSLRRFTAEELSFIKKCKRAEKIVEAGSTVFLENSEHVHFYTILSGWAFRYKILEDGRRQILNFTLPSDLLGLQNAIFKTMKHSVEALTDLTLCVFDRNQLWELYTNHPDLAFDTTWIAAREENLVGDNLVSVGRRTGIERVAYVLLHLFSRAEQLQLTEGNKLRLPVTQQQIADALGLSIVHTNTTIQRLTKLGLITWKQGIFLLRDRDGLAAIAMYRYEDASPRPFI